MRVAESIILDALTRGGCIKTFYRISSRQAGESATRIPEGYILESPGEREDIVLSRGLSCAGEAAGAEGNLGAGGRCDLFWWGNMAAETDCTELNN
ncbi:TPA: hypothetical protein ACP7SW_004495 [Escherichia coli]